MREAQPILILVVEDDAVAARLELEHLSAPGRDVQHVTTLRQAQTFCRERRPDLLLLDNSLPDGRAEQLLDLLAALPGGIPPFIIVTGAGDEELAVAMMKRGARDYLTKTAQFILQLPTVVSRVLRELEGQAELQRVQQELQQSRLDYQCLVENSPDIIARFDRDARHLFVSRAVERYVGRPASDFHGRSNEELGMPEDLCRQWRQALAGVFASGAEDTFQFTFSGLTGPCIFESRLIPEHNERGEVATVLALVRDVSRQLRAEQEAAQRGRHLETLFEASYAGIIQIDKDGIVQFVNRRVAEMFGISAEALIGMRYADLLHPEEYCTGTECMERMIRGEIGHILTERHYLRRDRTSFWGLLSGRRLCSANGEFETLVCIINDISDLRNAEEQLQSSQRNLLQAQELGKIASFEWDLASGNIDWTPQGFALLERAAGTFEQTIAQWFAFVEPEDRPQLQRDIDTVLARGGVAQSEYRLVMPDGRHKHILTIGEVVLAADGRPKSMVGVSQDVSERKRVELELAEAAHRAEAANRAKSGFLANMSHELRTPLNGILGMLQLLETTTLDAEQQEYTQIASSSGWSLLSLINDILDLSRVEAGRLEIRSEPFDIREIVGYSLQFFRQPAMEKGLVLHGEIDAAIPPALYGDVTRIRQILFNVIGNALKFTPQGTVKVSVVPLCQSPTGHTRLALTVKDSGIGMSAEMLGRVFEPFFQEDNSYQRRYQGAGLGLSIVKRLAELMAGEVRIESKPGTGTTVTVELEVATVSAAATTVAVGKELAGAGTGAARRLSVLVAEDNPVNQKTVVAMLRRAGHNVVTAGNGIEALQLLAESRIDVVLMDVQMPELNGLEATQRVRRDTSGTFDPAVPIIGLTAFAMPGDRDHFIAAGMDDCLSKPLVWTELAALLARFSGAGTASLPATAGLHCSPHAHRLN